MHPHNVVWLEI